MEKIIKLTDAIFCPFGCPAGVFLNTIDTASTVMTTYINSVVDDCFKLDYQCQGCKKEFTIVCKAEWGEACYIDNNHHLLAGRKICNTCIQN